MKLLVITAIIFNLFSIQAHGYVSKEEAAMVAADYVLELQSDIEDMMDDSLEEALVNPEVKKGRYNFILLDSSGDCGWEISIFKKSGRIDYRNSHSDWQCL